MQWLWQNRRVEQNVSHCATTGYSHTSPETFQVALAVQEIKVYQDQYTHTLWTLPRRHRVFVSRRPKRIEVFLKGLRPVSSLNCHLDKNDIKTPHSWEILEKCG